MPLPWVLRTATSISESLALLHEILLIESHFELDLRESKGNSSSRLILTHSLNERKNLVTEFVQESHPPNSLAIPWWHELVPSKYTALIARHSRFVLLSTFSYFFCLSEELLHCSSDFNPPSPVSPPSQASPCVTTLAVSDSYHVRGDLFLTCKS